MAIIMTLWIGNSSVYMGILGQPFQPIFPHFSKLGPLFKKTLKTLKILKKNAFFSKIYHKTHHFMIYLTTFLILLTEIHFLKFTVKNFYPPQNHKIFRGPFY